jgi:hypothetical protein
MVIANLQTQPVRKNFRTSLQTSIQRPLVRPYTGNARNLAKIDADLELITRPLLVEHTTNNSTTRDL